MDGDCESKSVKFKKERERDKDLLRPLNVVNFLTITITIANTRKFTMNVYFYFYCSFHSGGCYIKR